MNLKIQCPQCKAQIDVSKQIEMFAAAEGRKEAEKRLESEREKIRQEARWEESEKNKKRVTALVKANTIQARSELEKEFEEGYREKLEKKDLLNAELQKKVQSAQTRAQELEAKLSQGSPQTQGIIAERNLEDFLKANLPKESCRVQVFGQGKKGTDIRIGILKNGKEIGAIIVDDKFADKWNTAWPEKVWQDMQDHKAQLAYIAANVSAFPNDPELKEAGFGLAPCRKAGVKVWLVDRGNFFFLKALILDAADKLLKQADIQAVYGNNSGETAKLKAYLANHYETDVRDKMKNIKTVLSSLEGIHKKVEQEYERSREALFNACIIEKRMFEGLYVNGATPDFLKIDSRKE